MNDRIDRQVIEEIIRVSKKMEELKLVNTFEGNLSIRKDGLLYITPARTRKSTLTEDIIAVFDEDDNQIFGKKKASSEKIMHLGAYSVRDDIKAVIHCHSPYLTAHAMCHVPIDYKCHPEILFHFKDIPVAPYGKPGTDEIIDNAKPFLKNRNVVLLGNHGVLAVGSTLEKTFARIESAEKFAQIINISKNVGPLVDLPQSEIERFLAVPMET
ncbi:MAG: class II aldolase/adducin family protein [Anaerolineaceae bacterium]|nr:class II aldolase/adducin family protein [Anaerolineaceae bacterium]